MSEKHKGESRNKSSKRSSADDRKNSRCNKKSNKYFSNGDDIESKTPPLPVKHTTIEELLKRRDCLKKELIKCGSHSNSHLRDTQKHEKYKKHRDTRETHNQQTRKNYVYGEERMKERTYSSKSPIKDNDNYKLRKRHVYAEERKKERKYHSKSPVNDDDNMQLESEDEEFIIEQRRKKRKQLLEQLNVSCEEKGDNRISSEKHTSTVASEDTEDKLPLSPVKPITEIATDMFSDKCDFISISCENIKQDNNDIGQLRDNWDDSDGYFNVKLGDIIHKNRYRIVSILGKGVFANVVRALDNTEENTEVAIKIIRNNDLMYQSGLKEIATLKEINKADPDNRYHCIKLLDYFMHKGHLCLVLESLHLDLRSIIKRYGKNNGISMNALMIYSRQLFIALRLLKKIGVIHADIKPDNILVNEKKNILKLCDFGSAAKVDDGEPTPYLVSRFYRAPEIILGVPYNHSVDTWSTACTIYEMATGNILFTGNSNNKMLKCFMDLKGKIPSRLIRKGKFKDQHFNFNHNFLLHRKEESNRMKYTEMSNISIVRDLQKDLTKSCKNLTVPERRKLIQLKDLLDKMLMLDPRQRISNTDCLRHSFIQDDI